MTDRSVLESTSVTERLVLFELAEFDESGRTPAQAPAILKECRDRLETLEEVAGGRLNEAELLRACHALNEQGLVSEVRPDETSPVGKGRPAYDIDVDPAAIREFVGEDDRFAGEFADGA